jgi:hypothetical protein
VDVDGFFEHPNSSKGRKFQGKFVPRQDSKPIQTETKKEDEIGEQKLANKKQNLLESDADEEKIAKATLDCTSSDKTAGEGEQGAEEKEAEATKVGEKKKPEKRRAVRGEQNKMKKLIMEVNGEGSPGTVAEGQASCFLKLCNLSSALIIEAFTAR